MRRCAPLSALGTFHGNHRKRDTARSKERKRARVKYPTTAILSSCGAFVAPRTMAGPNSSHSLKAAESAARCPHTGKGTARLLEASRSLSGVISSPYGLGKDRSRPNGKHHKLADTVSITRHGAQLASQTAGRGRYHKLPRASEHHKLPVTSLHHPRPARVGVKNWRGGLVSETVLLIREFYGKQFFIPSTISLAYMISGAYRSARNDKFCLYSTNVLLRMKIIFREYTCTTP